MKGLIDTNIIIQTFRKKPEAVGWFGKQTDMGISTVVWLELIEGAGSKVKEQDTLSLISSLTIIPLTEVDQHWAMVQLLRYRLSHGLLFADCLIASAAYRLQIPIYTQNVKDFLPMLGAALVINPLGLTQLTPPQPLPANGEGRFAA
jgi:predicted nucleic acid-binding protein